MYDKRILCAGLTMLLIAGTGAAAPPPQTPDRAMTEVLRRLDALEQQNRELALELAELRRANETLRADSAVASQHAGTNPDASPSAAPAPMPAALEWASRLRLTGDFRFRHEHIEVEETGLDQTRETIRARIGAAINFAEGFDGEIAFATGGAEPRGGSATLGAASSRKAVGLDLGYARWRPMQGLALTAGKMRQPFVRPSLSLFIDNEIRPEGIAANYETGGFNASAFGFWLEERPQASDSTVRGAQLGWSGVLDRVSLRLGGGYFDYRGIQGTFPGFANGLVGEFGNSVTGSGPDARYLYDYDIGEVYAETSVTAGPLPLRLFADYARNFAADEGVDTAVSAGIVVGQASEPGRWEATILTQSVEKDALFGHWIDSDFGGGVTDNAGQLYRLTWRPVKNLLMNLTYMDTAFNVDHGIESDYDRWQLEANLLF